MSALAQVFVGLAALLHVLFFVMESVLFMRPDVHRRFGLRTREEAELVRPMAYNQGFYNLFLAIGAVVRSGLGGRRRGRTPAAPPSRRSPARSCSVPPWSS